MYQKEPICANLICFDLEYQDGSTNDHYRCTDELTEEQVVAIFQAYRSGDESWKSKSVWERHKWW